MTMKYEEWVDKKTLKDFHKATARFTLGGQIVHAAIGLSGEAGEVLELIKKNLFYGKDVPMEKLKEELGDVLFYLTMFCNALNTSLEEIALLNVQKLEKRYASNFTEAEALERKDEQ